MASPYTLRPRVSECAKQDYRTASGARQPGQTGLIYCLDADRVAAPTISRRSVVRRRTLRGKTSSFFLGRTPGAPPPRISQRLLRPEPPRGAACAAPPP